MFYTGDMTKHRLDPRHEASFSLKVGSWLEASATGWGVVAVPVVILVVVGAAALKWLV